MASNMLAAIRAAVSARAEDEEIGPEKGQTGANAPSAKETEMSTISQADHDAAVTAAEARGREAGLAAQLDRLNVALNADGVKGNLGRVSAAVDLAVKSPGMSGADIAAFVVANVTGSAANAAVADTEAAQDQRVAAAGLAQPSKPAEPTAAAAAGWAKTAERINRRNG